MCDKGARDTMLYPKTKIIYIEDIGSIETLMQVMLIDEGVVDIELMSPEQLEVFKNPKNRLKFIKDFVDTYAYANSIWRLDAPDTYDSYMEPHYNRYFEEEFPFLEKSSAELREVFNIVEEATIEILPDIMKRETWSVWSISSSGTSLVIRNEGDWRILNFAKNVIEDKDHPYHGKVTRRQLYTDD